MTEVSQSTSRSHERLLVENETLNFACVLLINSVVESENGRECDLFDIPTMRL